MVRPLPPLFCEETVRLGSNLSVSVCVCAVHLSRRPKTNDLVPAYLLRQPSLPSPAMNPRDNPDGSRSVLVLTFLFAHSQHCASKIKQELLDFGQPHISGLRKSPDCSLSNNTEIFFSFYLYKLDFSASPICL